MGTTKENCYSVQCDNCKDIWENPITGFNTWVDENSAIEDATSSGDWIEIEEIRSIYCPKCYNIDDEDNITIDITRTVK